MTTLLLAEWRDFYVMVGTASGAIIGASFVVASLMSGSDKRTLGIRGFITPTAVHLGTVLVSSAVLAVPSMTPAVFAGFFGLGGLGGAVYAVIVVTRIWRAQLDLSDRFWYAIAPIVAYVTVASSAWCVLSKPAQALDFLAVALIGLLVIGMRNLWDMATFMILRDRDPS